MNALQKGLQREPAFPDGSPSWRPIMGAGQIATQASDQNAGPRRPASEAQSPRSPGALGLHEPTHVPATGAPPSETTDPASASGRQPFAIAGAQCDTHF